MISHAGENTLQNMFDSSTINKCTSEFKKSDFKIVAAFDFRWCEVTGNCAIPQNPFLQILPQDRGIFKRKNNNQSNLDKKLTEKTELISSLKETISNILLAIVSGLNSIYSFPKVSGP